MSSNSVNLSSCFASLLLVIALVACGTKIARVHNDIGPVWREKRTGSSTYRIELQSSVKGSGEYGEIEVMKHALAAEYFTLHLRAWEMSLQKNREAFERSNISSECGAKALGVELRGTFKGMAHVVISCIDGDWLIIGIIASSTAPTGITLKSFRDKWVAVWHSRSDLILE